MVASVAAAVIGGVRAATVVAAEGSAVPLAMVSAAEVVRVIVATITPKRGALIPTATPVCLAKGVVAMELESHSQAGYKPSTSERPAKQRMRVSTCWWWQLMAPWPSWMPVPLARPLLQSHA